MFNVMFDEKLLSGKFDQTLAACEHALLRKIKLIVDDTVVVGRPFLVDERRQFRHIAQSGRHFSLLNIQTNAFHSRRRVFSFAFSRLRLDLFAVRTFLLLLLFRLFRLWVDQLWVKCVYVNFERVALTKCSLTRRTYVRLFTCLYFLQNDKIISPQSS